MIVGEKNEDFKRGDIRTTTNDETTHLTVCVHVITRI